MRSVGVMIAVYKGLTEVAWALIRESSCRVVNWSLRATRTKRGREITSENFVIGGKAVYRKLVTEGPVRNYVHWG